MPVVMPQPSRQTFSSGASLLTLCHRDFGQHGVFAERRGAHVVIDRLAIQRESRGPVGHQSLALRDANGLAKIGLARRAEIALSAFRGVQRNDMIADLTEVTPAPISSTTAPPSWPSTPGNMPSGSSPERVKASVWQTPVATFRSRTSPAFGPSRSSISISSGLPASQATAARVFIKRSPRVHFSAAAWSHEFTPGSCARTYCGAALGQTGGRYEQTNDSNASSRWPHAHACA